MTSLRGSSLGCLTLSITVVFYLMASWSFSACSANFWVFINLSARHVRAHLSWPQASPWCHQCWHFQLKGIWCMTMACFHIGKGALTWSAFNRVTIQTWKPSSGCTFCRSVWNTSSVGLQNRGWPTSFLNFLFWNSKAEWLPDFSLHCSSSSHPRSQYLRWVGGYP